MVANIKHVRKIEVSQKTYDRLQQRAVPFEDTPESVIVKLLDESRGQEHPSKRREDGETGGAREGVTAAPPESGQRFGTAEIDIVVDDPLSPPSLKHAKVLCADVDGLEVTKANWTKVRQAVVTLAFNKGGYNLRRLLEVCPMNAVETSKNDDGYTYFTDLGVSIQGQDANHAWQATVAVARALGVHVKVWFQWRTKPDAAYPGKRGLLTIG